MKGLNVIQPVRDIPQNSIDEIQLILNVHCSRDGLFINRLYFLIFSFILLHFRRRKKDFMKES